MVHIRLTTFMFMLMLTLLEARNSIFKHPHYQGLVEIKVAPQSDEHVEDKSIHQTIVSKGLWLSAVSIEEKGSKMSLNGRKLASQGIFKREKEQAKMSINGTSSKISGATPSSWNCNHKGKRKLDVVCKQSGRSSSSSSHRPKKAKFPDGFVALSADYHYPNSHPPRHN